AAPRRRIPAAALGARSPPRPPAGRRAGAPVLALRRRHLVLPDRSAAGSRGARRVRARPRGPAPGVRVRARGPRNHFPLQPASAYRFVAGGIGITPILPMLRAVEADVPWTLLYGGRARDTMAFTGELTTDHPRERVRLVEGTLDLREHLEELRPGELVYACGPASL